MVERVLKVMMVMMAGRVKAALRPAHVPDVVVPAVAHVRSPVAPLIER